MFLPLGDDNSRRTVTPIMVWLVFGVNLFVWFLQLTIGEKFTLGFSTIPSEITHGLDLITPQAAMLSGHAVPIPQAPGPAPIQLTLLTSMFMHGSWAHIIGNMLYLLIFADQIEDLLGHVGFVLFYLVCGFAASAAHIFVDPNSVVPSLGASGAIAGVLGAYLVKYPSNGVRVLMGQQVVEVPAYIVLGMWIVLQLISQVNVFAGADSGVAYMAHIGGFFAGILLITLFGRRSRTA